jgi:hypothetical protein
MDEVLGIPNLRSGEHRGWADIRRPVRMFFNLCRAGSDPRGTYPRSPSLPPILDRKSPRSWQLAIDGEMLEHQVEQLHRLRDLGFRHWFERSRFTGDPYNRDRSRLYVGARLESHLCAV